MEGDQKKVLVRSWNFSDIASHGVKYGPQLVSNLCDFKLIATGRKKEFKKVIRLLLNIKAEVALMKVIAYERKTDPYPFRG